ncbi:hypothetical protein CP969_29905 [Streptomyces viridosporus T7A]|uniref:Uncharacterized protein n=1 Tax=Streptomyces viridosporus T7A TaxID=665577 RepID=A0ABX6ALK0_STRVD|nr:hypothetical protein CP969_29905 [Streptomyces viridosporus T7A]
MRSAAVPGQTGPLAALGADAGGRDAYAARPGAATAPRRTPVVTRRAPSACAALDTAPETGRGRSADTGPADGRSTGR